MALRGTLRQAQDELRAEAVPDMQFGDRFAPVVDPERSRRGARNDNTHPFWQILVSGGILSAHVRTRRHSMVRKTVGYVELEWTCPNCNSRNPGPNKFCNGCGAPQPDDVEFEQPAEEKLITDQAKIARAKAGPDVHCPYCGTRNPGDAKFCGSCGGDLTGATARQAGRVVGVHRTAPAGMVNCPSCHAENDATAFNCSQCGASLADVRAKPVAPEPPTPTAAVRKPFPGGLAIGLIVFCFAVVAGVFFLFIRTETFVGQVQSVEWTRSIPILAMGEVENEDWLEDIPSDAEIGTCRLEHHHTQDEPAPNAEEVCGEPYTLDTGSGYGEVVQDCVYEVYEEYCSYTMLDWIEIDTITASGGDLNPYWPQVNLQSDQQQGEGEESYEIVFMADDVPYTYTTTDSAEFSQFTVGSTWQLNVNALDAVVSVEPDR